MYITNNNIRNNYTPSFGKFIKITNTTDNIAKFRDKLKAKNDEFVTLAVKKNKTKTILYLFSKKHFDEFIRIGTSMHFGTFKRNLEKYTKSTPKKMSLKEASKELI